MDGGVGRGGMLETLRARLESYTDQQHRLIEMTSILIASWRYCPRVSKVS